MLSYSNNSSIFPPLLCGHEVHRNRKILMYCTGGVRCEKASALIMARGKEFQDVVQLSGGIERYLQAFPEKGFFHGKNFVFDERLSVPEVPAGGVVVGRCTLCQQPWDDYGHRCRCHRCRLLLLVCDKCYVNAKGGSEVPPKIEPTTLPILSADVPDDELCHTKLQCVGNLAKVEASDELALGGVGGQIKPYNGPRGKGNGRVSCLGEEGNAYALLLLKCDACSAAR
ncbi:unnamed protein product [Choristocarpus tenellus]